MPVNAEVFAPLRGLLAQLTITAEAEIIPESHLEEDLGMDLALDRHRLIKAINKRFAIDLEAETLFAELEAAGATVLELTKLIHDELELG